MPGTAPGTWQALSTDAQLLIPSPVSPHPPGLPDRPDHQRQRELLPYIQEDVPAQARSHGHQPRSPSRPRGLGPPVLKPLPQRIAAHVSFGALPAELLGGTKVGGSGSITVM